MKLTTMLNSPGDLAKLLEAMGEYQDQKRSETGDSSDPTMVQQDWAFHEQRTGFDRAKISRLLPQLVAACLAEDVAGHTPSGRAANGMRPADGWAWISDRGQLELSHMRQPPPPLQIALDSIGPQAEMQLLALFKKASELGVSKNGIRRLEDLLQEIVSSNEASRMEKTSNLVQFIAGSKDLTIFFLTAVLPLLRSVVGS